MREWRDFFRAVIRKGPLSLRYLGTLPIGRKQAIRAWHCLLHYTLFMFSTSESLGLPLLTRLQKPWRPDCPPCAAIAGAACDAEKKDLLISNPIPR